MKNKTKKRQFDWTSDWIYRQRIGIMSLCVYVCIYMWIGDYLRYVSGSYGIDA